MWNAGLYRKKYINFFEDFMKHIDKSNMSTTSIKIDL